MWKKEIEKHRLSYEQGIEEYLNLLEKRKILQESLNNINQKIYLLGRKNKILDEQLRYLLLEQNHKE